MARKAADTEMERNYVTVILCAVDLYRPRGLAHNRKASSALSTLVERENNSFQVPAKTATKERVTDLAGSLVTSSGPATEKARRPNM